jgi:aminopeptidase N
MWGAMTLALIQVATIASSSAIVRDDRRRSEDDDWDAALAMYLREHRKAELEGRGAEYRRTTLQLLQDVPAADDRGVHVDARTKALARDPQTPRALFLLHMLRRRVGDEAFALRAARLAERRSAHKTSQNDVAHAFDDVAGDELRTFLQAWTTRAGLPSLWLAAVGEQLSGDGLRRQLQITLQQTQPEPPWPMTVPVAITLVDGRQITTEISFAAGERSSIATTTTVSVPAPVARVDVDPFFEVMRTLAPSESPPTVSRALGAAKMIIVTPSMAGSAERDAWLTFATGLCPDQRRCIVVDDVTVKTLPDDAAVWVLGSSSYLRGGAFALSRAYGLRFDDHGLFAPGAWERVLQAADRKAAYEQERVGAEKTAIVVVVEHPRNPRLVMAFVGAPRPTMIPRMLQSLQHYGDYTVVGFQSDAVDSTLALRVSAVSSSMALVVRPGVASSLLPPAALILPSSAP